MSKFQITGAALMFTLVIVFVMIVVVRPDPKAACEERGLVLDTHSHPVCVDPETGMMFSPRYL